MKKNDKNPKESESDLISENKLFFCFIFSEEEVSSILKAVLKGLAPVHDLNYIHRDIKPENIILAPMELDSPTKLRSDDMINAN